MIHPLDERKARALEAIAELQRSGKVRFHDARLEDIQRVAQPRSTTLVLAFDVYLDNGQQQALLEQISAAIPGGRR